MNTVDYLTYQTVIQIREQTQDSQIDKMVFSDLEISMEKDVFGPLDDIFNLLMSELKASV